MLAKKLKIDNKQLNKYTTHKIEKLVYNKSFISTNVKYYY
jgi:hypothetical protein